MIQLVAIPTVYKIFYGKVCGLVHFYSTPILFFLLLTVVDNSLRFLQ